MNRAISRLGQVFILVLLATACSKTTPHVPGQPGSPASDDGQTSASEFLRSATSLLTHPQMEDKIDRSALDPRWVHVSPAEARQYAHCGNKPRMEQGRDATANVVWLTVDDHPAGHEEKVDTFLALGERYNVRFRFFPVTHWTDQHPEVIAKLRNAGHEVNNHTRNHIRLDQASDVVVTEQVTKGILGGPYFRPPFGAYDDRVVKAAQSVGQTICMWTVNTADYSTPATSGDKALVRGPQDMLQRVQEHIGAHAVILIHFHGQYTLDALPLIIEWLRENGYQPELLHR